MRFVLFCHSLLSDWNHGNAHFLRGVVTELCERGHLVDVYELIINGVEISPGYTELNDPMVQRERLLAQAGEETQRLDEEFLLALEYGMPPAGGFGLGIDRLTMLLTGAESIRDVILFPLLKPKRVP